MLALPRPFAGQVTSNLPATPSTSTFGTRATAGGSANTKGSWSQVTASLPHDAYGFWLTMAGTATSATSTDGLLDIGIGAGGSEVVLVPDLLAGWIGSPTQGPRVLFIPIFIPKGTRVAIRNQGVIASDTVDCMFHFKSGDPANRGQLFSGCDAYGVNSSGASAGTAHTPGNTGAESTWANLGSTASKSYGAILPLIQVGTVTTLTAIAYHWELGIGSVTLAEWYYMGNTGEYLNGPFPSEPAAVNIASGAQLQVRAEASGTAIAFDVAAYCFY